tara:strand:- start:3333 stop:4226 length:894 start_codon:yes stop_codon:yes gene_type:complete
MAVRLIKEGVKQLIKLSGKSPYLGKDQKKADKATSFIGRGSEKSSTNQYSKNFKELANKGTYDSTDKVFVSVEGNRSGRISFDKEEIDKAIEANVEFITDNKYDRNRPYNIGERELAEYLESKGYKDPEGTGNWKKLEDNKQIDLFNTGGNVKNQTKQMLKKQEGGLLQEGGTVDPVSGNEVPIGSTKSEVRDDIPAQLSEGEFVFPADVVRFIGLNNLMKLRQEAKEGLNKMDRMGQMGNADEAVEDDTGAFDTDIDSIIDEVEKEMATKKTENIETAEEPEISEPVKKKSIEEIE